MRNDAATLRDWSNRLDRFRRSNSTLTQFCRDENVTMSAFNYWRRRTQKLSAKASIATADGRIATRMPPVNSSLPAHSSSSDRRVKQHTGTSPCSSLDLVGDNCPSKSPTASPLQFTIQTRSVCIHCQCDSLEAIEILLSWSVRHQASGFQQLLVEG